MAKRKYAAWVAARDKQLVELSGGEQEEVVEPAHIEEYRSGRCICGCGGFSLSLSAHHIIRICKECGKRYNVDTGQYM